MKQCYIEGECSKKEVLETSLCCFCWWYQNAQSCDTHAWSGQALSKI